ncbi:hypothetical protein [Cupriavidus sp. USMAHM13]|nr:hypothetical protein [Cupriavidus sp. USMAHM13]
MRHKPGKGGWPGRRAEAWQTTGPLRDAPSGARRGSHGAQE